MHQSGPESPPNAVPLAKRQSPQKVNVTLCGRLCAFWWLLSGFWRRKTTESSARHALSHATCEPSSSGWDRLQSTHRVIVAARLDLPGQPYAITTLYVITRTFLWERIFIGKISLVRKYGSRPRLGSSQPLVSSATEVT